MNGLVCFVVINDSVQQQVQQQLSQQQRLAQLVYDHHVNVCCCYLNIVLINNYQSIKQHTNRSLHITLGVGNKEREGEE